MVQVAPQLYVANLFGQLSFGRDKRQTNYAALGTALFRAMKEHPNATFRVPYGLGCGLAGGNWVTVLNLIEEAANAWNVNVEILVLPKKWRISMYNTNYICVKPFDVWLDAIGQDGKKIPYRVKRGTIWRLEWCGGEQSFKELSGPDKMHITLPDEYVEKYFKKV